MEEVVEEVVEEAEPAYYEKFYLALPVYRISKDMKNQGDKAAG